MRPRKTFSVYVLLVGVMGLSIVGGILAFQIFTAATKSQLTSEQQAAIKPIDGSIDQVVIDNLDQRITISNDEINNVGVVSAGETTNTVSPTPSVSLTPSISPTPATQSAETTQP